MCTQGQRQAALELTKSDPVYMTFRGYFPHVFDPSWYTLKTMYTLKKPNTPLLTWRENRGGVIGWVNFLKESSGLALRYSLCQAVYLLVELVSAPMTHILFQCNPFIYKELSYKKALLTCIN